MRENYSVERLPEDLREGLSSDANVRLTIEIELPPIEKVLTLKELLALRRPPYRSIEQIVADVRRDRDEWD